MSYTGTKDLNVLLFQLRVHLTPCLAGLQYHTLLVSGDCRLVQPLKADGDAVLDVGCSWHYRVSTAPSSNWTTRTTGNEETSGYILGCLRLEDTSWSETPLLSGPVRLDEALISIVKRVEDLVFAVVSPQRTALLSS